MSNRKHRAETLMRVLTRQVRAVSLDQATRIVRSLHGKDSSVGSLLGWLHDEGMIETTSVAVACPRVQDRILLWHQRRPTPKHEHTRWLLQCRWADLTPQVMPVYWATKKAERFYGGVAGLLSHADQLEHDLGTAEVLTVTIDKRGNVFKAIEFGGQYSVDRLRRLHEAFQRQRIRYELW